MKKWVKSMLAGAVASVALAFGSSAFANSIEVTSVSVTGSGPFTYTYNLDLTTGNNIQNGDFFVIYDFAGLTGESQSLATTGGGSWTITPEATTSPQAPFQNVPDSPSLMNVRFTYNASGVSQDIANASASALNLGSVSLVTSIGPSGGKVFYSGADHNSGTAGQGDPGGNSFTALGPTAAPLPSTASMGLTMIAACGIAGAAMKLRRKDEVVA